MLLKSSSIKVHKKEHQEELIVYEVSVFWIPSIGTLMTLTFTSTDISRSHFSSLREGKVNRSLCFHYSADRLILRSSVWSRQRSGLFNVKLSDAEAAVAISVEHQCPQRQPAFSVKEWPLAPFLMTHISSCYLFFFFTADEKKRANFLPHKAALLSRQ